MALHAISSAASHLYENVQTAIGIPTEHTKSISKKVRIQRLFVHPIKSCRGTSISETSFDDGGLKFDRSWLIIDAESKKFQTARDLPKMVTIVPRMDLANNILSVEIPLHENGQGSVTITTPLEPNEEDLRKMELVKDVTIWVHKVDGYAVSKGADEALTKFFGKPVRLIRKGPMVRPSGPDDPRGITSAMHFQDFYPFLIASSASLDHVQQTLLASVYSNMTASNGGLPVQEESEHPTYQDASDATANQKDATPPGGWNGSGESGPNPGSMANNRKVIAYKVPQSVRRDYWTPEALESFEIERFRPNVLVESFDDDGKEDVDDKALVPWEEDGWTHIEVFNGRSEAAGDLEPGWGKDAEGKGIGIDCVARCARCQVPGIDPNTGYRDSLPYLVLQKFRQVQQEFKSIGKPCFGMLSAPCAKTGTLRVGDIVRITATTDPAKRTMRVPGK